MQDQHDSYSNPLQQIEMQPHLLNELTENYLEQLCSSTPGIARWETIQILMKQLSDDQTSIEQCLLLFNCLKVIINETFASIDGLKDNKMYGWICMLYGVKCGILADNFQNQQIKDSKDDFMWMQNTCYALLLSEMVIHMAQKSSKSGTSNRIFYPQFYRLISIILEKVASLKDLNLSAVELPQSQNVTQIKSTNILQYLRQLRQQQNGEIPLKVKKSKQKSNKINVSKTCALILSKITQLLLRSFALCKKKTIEKLNIVAELINVHLSQFKVDQHGQSNQATFQAVIDRYFEHFKILQDQSGKQEQIDDENKMIEVKELTPRFIDQDAGFELKKLRIKKKKLIKKIESDAKTAKVRKLQQRKILNDVRNQRSLKRHKKQMFVLEKQTQEAKKQHNKMKRIKQIRKGGKSGEKKSVKK